MGISVLTSPIQRASCLSLLQLRNCQHYLPMARARKLEVVLESFLYHPLHLAISICDCFISRLYIDPVHLSQSSLLFCPSSQIFSYTLSCPLPPGTFQHKLNDLTHSQAQSFSRVQLSVTLWTVAHQAPLSRQEYWTGQPFPSPGDLPDLWNEPESPALQADSLLSDLLEKLG